MCKSMKSPQWIIDKRARKAAKRKGHKRLPGQGPRSHLYSK